MMHRLIIALLAAFALSAHAQTNILPATPAARASVLRAGEAALEDGVFDFARLQFEPFLSGGATSEEWNQALEGWFHSLHGLGRSRDVINWHDAHRGELAGQPIEGGATYWVARSLYDDGRPGDALAALDQFEVRFPGHARLRDCARLRAHSLAKVGRTADAIAAFAAFDRDHGLSADAAQNLLDWAGALMAEGRQSDAEKVLRDLISRFPASREAMNGEVWLGHLLASTGRRVESRDIFERITTNTQFEADLAASAWMGLSALAQAETNRTASAEYLKQAESLTHTPSVVIPVRMGRAKLAVQAGEEDEAIALLKETIEQFAAAPGIGDVQLELARILLERKDYADALENFQQYLEAITDHAGEARALTGKAWCLWHLRRYPEAADAFDKAYAAHPDAGAREAALRQAAAARMESGQNARALEQLEQARSEFPASEQNLEGDFLRVECLARLKRYGDAERVLRELEAGDPDGTKRYGDRALLRLAALAEQQNHLEKAITIFDELLAKYPLTPLGPRVLQDRALTRYRAGDFVRARTDFEAIIEKYPSTQWAEKAFYMRAWCLMMQGQDKAARKIAEEFVDKFPDSVWHPDVAFWLGELDYNAGEYERAEKRFLEIWKAHPSHPRAAEALYWAGRAASGQDDFRRAVAHWNELVKNATDSWWRAEARFGQGDALTELGEYAGAILAFDDVINNYPGSPLADRARGRKGDCQFTLGSDRSARYQEALATYRSLLESPTADADLKLQAEFKIGRCYEKMSRRAEALEHYLNAVYQWLDDRSHGDDRDALWFTRAAFHAASLLEREQRWDEAVKVYRRVVDSGVVAARDATSRINRIEERRHAKNVPVAAEPGEKP